MPKARSARDVWWVDVLLTQLEAKLGLTRPHRARGAHRGGRRAGQRRRDRPVERPPGGHHLRGRRPVRVPARPGGRELRPGRRVPGGLLALRPGAGPGRGPGRRDRRHRRALPRLPGPRRLPARRPSHASLLGYDGKWAIHPDQVAHRQRGVRTHGPRRSPRRRGGHRDLPCRGGRRDRRHRSGRPAGGRRPHAVWPPTCCTRRHAGPGRGPWGDDPGGGTARPPGGAVGHRQHRELDRCGPRSNIPGSSWWAFA